jgi:hypothetical protein
MAEQECFWGAFRKFGKTTISFIMSVCLSVGMKQQLGSQWTDFNEIRYLMFLENLSRKFKWH